MNLKYMKTRAMQRIFHCWRRIICRRTGAAGTDGDRKKRKKEQARKRTNKKAVAAAAVFLCRKTDKNRFDIVNHH